MKILLFMAILAVSSCATYSPDRTIARFESLKAVENLTPVANEVTSEEHLESFSAEFCKGIPSADCMVKLNKMFMARLERAYPNVQWSEITSTCEAYPSECKEMQGVETIAIRSHNNTIDRAMRETIRKEQLDHEARTAAALSAFGNSLQQQNQQMQQQQRHDQMMNQLNRPVHTNCMTNAFGQTTCTSY